MNPTHPTDATPTANGRDDNGRFTKGNRGGPGNPFARQCAAFRKALHAAVDEDDIRVLAEDLLVKAKCGDLAAIKLLLAYTIGKPTEAPDPDRLDLEEWRMMREEVDYTSADLRGTMHGLPVGFWLSPLRLMQDHTQTQMCAHGLEQLGPADAPTANGPAAMVPPAPEVERPTTNGRTKAAADRPPAHNGKKKRRRDAEPGPARGGKPPTTNGRAGLTAEQFALLDRLMCLAAAEEGRAAPSVIGVNGTGRG